MKFWETPAFKALQRAWYERLKAEGFEDAETTIGEMKRYCEYPLRNADELTFKTKQAYFLALSQRVEHETFPSDIDKLIMARHAEGETFKAICDELEAKGETRCRHTIRFTIRKYEMAWGLRLYTPRQLNRK